MFICVSISIGNPPSECISFQVSSDFSPFPFWDIIDPNFPNPARKESYNKSLNFSQKLPQLLAMYCILGFTSTWTKSSVSDYLIPLYFSYLFRLLKPAIGWFSANLSCSGCWVMGMKMIMVMINIWDRGLSLFYCSQLTLLVHNISAIT